MYLKKIHIQGFKSFADKTEIKFKNDITAIVGPNGSGKSNISDAIRWVLGEQSIKSLRGNKMEDIIFAGTNKRRALSFSEVTIFFDNKDGSIPLEYNEVAVTRRMFRSGESEYYINKNSCRLKDVRSIFMDTGIGKDGYSIIGQGRIDEILSNKPEDRRNIFEEAAGIIKYKTKKEESERKLRNTEENLIRINDLMSEISIQYNKLDKDSKKADEFLQTFNKLKDLEVNIFIDDISSIENRVETINIDKEQIETEILETERLRDEKRQVFNKLEIDMKEKEIQIESLRNKREDIILIKEDSKNNKSLVLEKENFYKKDLSRIKEELRSIDGENTLSENDLLNMKKNSETSADKLNKYILEYDEKEIQLNDIDVRLKEIEKKIDEKKHQTDLLYESIADKRGQLNSTHDQYSNSDQIIAELDHEQKELKSNINLISDKLNTLIGNKTAIEKKQNELFKDKPIFELENKKINENININIKKTRDLEISIERMNSSYNLYKNMEHSYEGYYKSVKNLLKSLEDKKLENNGFHGTVADLLSVDEKYEVAINISLGGNLQNIVVDNQGNAKEMINYLKENKLGRVTFLPMDTIKGKTLNLDTDKIKHQGLLGLAHNLIRYDENYNNIFKSLLGRTIIVDNIDNALKFAKETNNIYRLVTLEGEVLNPGGSLSGGSYRDNISIINRKTKIEKMKQALEKFKNEINSLKEEGTELKQKFELSNKKLDSLTVSIDKVNIDLININNDKNTLENEKNFLQRDINKTTSEIELFFKNSQENFKKAKEDKIILESDINRLDDLKEDLNIRVSSLSVERKAREELYKEYNNINLSIRIIENELASYNSEIINMEKKIGNNKKIKQEKVEEILLIEKSLEEILINKEEYNRVIEESVQKEEAINIDIKTNIENKDKYMNNFYKEQNNLKSINEKINVLERNNNNKELQLSKLLIERENIDSKMLNDYKLDLEEALLFKRPLDNIKKSRKDIKELKEEIKSIGNVNLGALEEYKEVKERFNFMETQHNDLVESKNILKDIIGDMEKKMRVNFLISFEEIKENFSEVFSELFNGGTATLELNDEYDDILKSGIEIKVKPPGKVLQTLSLLSGGEKSLVAVALLFAILKAKPSPFCILDEIDAALDDSNISRYTSYLKKINEDTQFILITHRKTSMEIANVLYGVTMEEKGISRMISMELKENKNELVS